MSNCRLGKLYYQKSGKDEKALEVYKKALEIYTEISGVDYPKIYELSRVIELVKLGQYS